MWHVALNNMLPWKRNIKIPRLKIKQKLSVFSMGLRIVTPLSAIKPTDVFGFLKFPYQNKLIVASALAMCSQSGSTGAEMVACSHTYPP